MPTPSRRSTVSCTDLQPSLSASSAVRPAASSHRQPFLSSLIRTATGIEPALLRTQCGARLRQPAWKPRSTCSGGRACHPHACCACPSPAPQVCLTCCLAGPTGAASLPAVPERPLPRACRRTPLLRVGCAVAAAAAPSRSESLRFH